jgi:hypothetical protein
MSHVETLFISWPVGLALSSWLFLQIMEQLGACGAIACAPPRRREIHFAETWSFV